jgi:Tubulin-tyrosine ligase family
MSFGIAIQLPAQLGGKDSQEILRTFAFAKNTIKAKNAQNNTSLGEADLLNVIQVTAPQPQFSFESPPVVLLKSSNRIAADYKRGKSQAPMIHHSILKSAEKEKEGTEAKKQTRKFQIKKTSVAVDSNNSRPIRKFGDSQGSKSTVRINQGGLVLPSNQGNLKSTVNAAASFGNIEPGLSQSNGLMASSQNLNNTAPLSSPLPVANQFRILQSGGTNEQGLRRLPRMERGSDSPTIHRSGVGVVAQRSNTVQRITNYSENLERLTAPPGHTTYYCSIARGNNHEMIQRVILNRTWWKRVPQLSTKAKMKGLLPTVPTHFFWRMMVNNFDFQPLSSTNGGFLMKQSINRFSHSEEISDKDNLYRNLWFLSQRQPVDLTSVVPLTYSFRMHEIQFEKDLQQFCLMFLANEKGCAPSDIMPINVVKDDKLKEDIPIYYEFGFEFPKRSYAGRKFQNIECNQVRKNNNFFHEKNLWIIKPSWCDRGKGVEIFKSLEELGKFLQMYTSGYNMSEYMNMNYTDEDNISPALKEGGMVDKAQKTIFPKFVIQKYMEQPALFKGLKFDIRSHALLTQEKELYIFRDSYVRLCSLPYTLEKQNYFAHLCNTAVNQKSDSFGALAAGNTISVGELAQFFDQQEAGTEFHRRIGGFEKYFFEEIQKLMKTAFDSVLKRANLLNPDKIPNSFELFGFDVMVDKSYKCWLIEANYIPGLTDDGSEYAKLYFDRMMDDMFKLTLDELYPTPRNSKRLQQHYPLLNFPPDENLWKLIYKYEN